jgi:DNA-binding response OmpR family regulator
MESKTIVLIEDNQELSRMYERAFRLHGYEVVVYDDGEKARTGLEHPAQMPSIIILDVMIPKVSGIDLLRSLRSQHEYDAVPILVITNSFAADDEREFLAMGADQYLVKIDHQVPEIIEIAEGLIRRSTASTGRSTSGTKVLLVEDDPYVSRVYERAFRAAGFELEIVHDGETGLATLASAKEKPAVILLDLTLPKMSGEEFFDHLKKDRDLSEIPVAILTNSFREDDEKHFKELGADLFLIKIDNLPSEVVEKAAGLINAGAGVAA